MDDPHAVLPLARHFVSRWFALIWLGVIVVVSFYPYDLQGSNEPLLDFLFYPLPYYQRDFDNLVNVVAYLPYGFALARVPHRRWLGFLFGCCVAAGTSLAVEVTQHFFAGRVSSNLDLLYNSDSVTEKTIAEYLQSEYLKLGISMTIHGEEEQSYRDNMKAGNFDMVFNICWGMPYDPQSSLAAMRAPVYGDYAAQQGLEDKAEIDEAITRILTSTDEAERQELYQSVLTNLHEDAMYLPLTYECNKALYTSALHGVHFGTDQYDVPFADMYFE